MKKNNSMFLLLALGALVSGALINANPTAVKADTEIVIKPFAEYKFQDAENLGKDTSGNGFDLVKMKSSSKEEAIQQLEDAGGKYLSIKHDAYGSGSLKDTGGAWLYAPELGNTNKDFSDLVDGNYTFTATIRSKYSFNEGNRYAINFGRYSSAINVVPWANGIEIACANTDYYDPNSGVEMSSWTNSGRIILPVPSELDEDWVTVTISGDKDSGKIRLFLNGEFVQETTAPNNGTRLTNVKAGDETSSYAFCIGGQCDVRGGSVDPLIGAICDYREVAIYDCKLSDQNIKELYDGNSAVISKQEEGNNSYVTELAPVDVSAIDLEVTDKNPVNTIVKDGFGNKKVRATTTNGTRSYNTIWYPSADGSTIKGKVLVDDAINVENFQASATYKYVCKLDYDPTKVDVSEVMLDNHAYNFGDEITAARHGVSFVLTPKEGVTIEGVSFNEMEWDPEEDDSVPEGSSLYYISFVKGAAISVETSGGDTTPEPQPGPDGGEQGGQDEQPAPTKKGCGGSVVAASAIISLLGIAGVSLLAFRKRED